MRVPESEFRGRWSHSSHGDPVRYGDRLYRHRHRVLLVAPPEPESSHEPRERADADEERDVADHPHPAQRLDPGLLQELGAAGEPQARLDAGVGLREAD